MERQSMTTQRLERYVPQVLGARGHHQAFQPRQWYLDTRLGQQTQPLPYSQATTMTSDMTG